MKKDKEKEDLSFEQQIELAIAEIEKKFGKGAIMRLSDKPIDIDVIPTSSINLNRALGVGGVPRGRIIEIFGDEAAGKTTLATNIMINAQLLESNKTVAIIDSEHVYDINYAKNQGLDLNNIQISQPSCAEEGLDITERLILSQAFSVIVIDSTAAMMPQSELEESFSDQSMAVQGRLFSRAARKFVSLLNKTNTTLIILSQMRGNIQKFGHGPNKIPTGGNAIKFYASQRIQLAKKQRLQKGENSPFNGVLVEAKIVKNKVAPPYRVAEMTILYGKGLVVEPEIIDLGSEIGVIKKTGAMYELDGTKYRGQDALLKYLFENPQIVEQLKRDFK